MSAIPVAQPRLEVRALNKTFGPNRVLTDVELSVRSGEVHGLVGQNGSGKSSLIKILTGVYRPDPGASYHVDGRPVRLPVRWPEVRRAGVTVVHQDLGLLDQLSVAENVCVGGFPSSWGRIDRGEQHRLTSRTLDRLGVEISPQTLVGELTAAQRAEVAIARALRGLTDGRGLVILDESTRALSGEDLERVHELLRRIAVNGSSALLISHNLAELVAVTDRVTILRDGRVVGSGLATDGLTEAEIARRMLGSALGASALDVTLRRPVDPPASPAPAAVTVSGLAGDKVAGIDFRVGKGEILGITGLPGSGYEEIPYLLCGATPARTGEVEVGASVLDLSTAGVRRCLRAGIVLVPERRDRDGLALELDVQDNISLPRLRQRGGPLFVGRRWQRDDAEAAVRELRIRPPAPTTLIKQLSGGNQQKVLLSKWLGFAPAVLVLHEPTQAVDVGARRDIRTAVRRAARSGVSVIVVSSEPDDLVATCGRVLVYRDGRGLQEAEFSAPEDLIRQIYATGAST